MSKLNYLYSMIVLGVVFMSATVIAQEFPIATGSDTTSIGAMAFDGTNYLISIMGDGQAKNNLTAQLISPNGTLVGSRISVGKTGGKGLLAFDGTNYLMVWSDLANVVYGRFINTSGNFVRTPFIIADTGKIGFKGGCMAYGDTTYMVVYKKNNTNYGQLVNKSGNLIGVPIRICSNESNEDAICFDGTNYLVAWRSGGAGETISVGGQLVSKSGVLVGSNFVIDDYASDNPVSIAFDGSRYLVAFHDRVWYKGGFYLSARFVTKSGSVTTDGFIIRDTTKFPCASSISFDGKNYLITWTDNFYKKNSVIMGRFFNTSGVPIDNAFTIFNSLGGKIPFAGGPVFGNNKFLVVATRVDTNFTSDDIYGKFIPSSATGINEEETNLTAKEFSLSQNYPNPFNPSTNISFNLPKWSFVSLKVFDLLGREVATILSGQLSAGNYSRTWKANGMPCGVYFYRLQAGKFTETKKLLLLK